jgi:hypothetical protein
MRRQRSRESAIPLGQRWFRLKIDIHEPELRKQWKKNFSRLVYLKPVQLSVQRRILQIEIVESIGDRSRN